MEQLSGDVDVVMLFAVLEHMTISERLTTLSTAAGVLDDGGIIVIAETPNRLLWNDYHTTETPFFGMLPDELALLLAGSIRRTELAAALVDPGATDIEREHRLVRSGRGVSHHELEAVFGSGVHEHIVATGWDPELRADRPEHRDELYLARFLAETEPHVASCFARYWLDLVLRPGPLVTSPLPVPVPLQTLGSTAVSVTPWETAIIDPGGAYRLDLGRAADRVVVNVVVGPHHADRGPAFATTCGELTKRFDLARHDADQWIQQADIGLGQPCESIVLKALDDPVEVKSVLFWPHRERMRVGALSHRRVALPTPDTVPRGAAAVSGLSSAMHGAYIGNDRMLVRLVGGGRLVVSANDLSLMPELVTEGSYDAPFTAFLRATLRPESVFVDVGANVGLFTVIGAQSAWRGRVIAYEPVPHLVQLLRDNVQLNWLADRVTVRDVAAGDRAGQRRFAFEPQLQALGGFAPDADATTVVDVVTLDEDLGHLDGIDLVKIDVEGGESAVLAGMERLIHAGRVRQISCEVRSDVLERRGSRAEWPRLVQQLHDLEARGWAFSLIDPSGALAPRSVEEVMATEPHPNVVATAPGGAPRR
jgi:FkbM family methyltransferase